MKHNQGGLFDFPLLGIISLILFSPVNLGAFQSSPVFITSPHEARTLKLLNEIWQPGCFKVYVVGARSEDFLPLSIIESRVLITEEFAESFIGKDNLLRALLAHEVAHGILKHGETRDEALENILVAMSRPMERTIESRNFKPLADAFPVFVAQVTKYLTLISAQEFEADETAIRILRTKGFDPQAFVMALESLPRSTIDGYGREYQEQSKYFNDFINETRDLFQYPPADSSLPANPDYSDRVAAARRKLASSEFLGGVNTIGCPPSLTDGDLTSLLARRVRQQAELAAKIQKVEQILTHFQGVVEKIEQAQPKLPLDEQYRIGKALVVKSAGATTFEAFAYLIGVVKQDPLFRDTLTLLGRAYYNHGLYEGSRMMLTRALIVNQDDAIAWMVFGLTQIRLGDEQKGLETIKGGITLFNKLSRAGYRGFPNLGGHPKPAIKGHLKTGQR